MAFTEKRLGASAPADTNNATLYTVPAATTAVMKSLRICNVTSSDATCRVFLVPSGGSAGVTNAIYYDFTVPANSTLSDDGFHVLATGGTIVVRSSVADTLTFTASGAEVS
jgi:hypothetical protein